MKGEADNDVNLKKKNLQTAQRQKQKIWRKKVLYALLYYQSQTMSFGGTVKQVLQRMCVLL